MAANTFPKSRETRAPLVEELVRFKDRLPVKFSYLTLAPLVDPEGNKQLLDLVVRPNNNIFPQKKMVKRLAECILY